MALTKYLHGGRADGVLISVSSTTTDYSHLQQLMNNGLPIVFFDRVCESLDTAKITTDDFESSYLASKHLIEQGYKRPAHLAISKNISIGNKRMEGYRKALGGASAQIMEILSADGGSVSYASSFRFNL